MQIKAEPFGTDIAWFRWVWSHRLRPDTCRVYIRATPGRNSQKGQKLASNKRAPSLRQARPGAITDEELEREKGGSGLRYSFDIKSGGAVYEVGVDAQTGTVLENKKEGPHPD